MRRSRPLTQQELSTLQHMLDTGYTYRAMAKRFGVCTDTLKRILMREGLAEFEGAKYVPAPKSPQVWQRPCIRCRTTEPRPKWQYICDPCKSDSGSSLPDNWLEMI